MKKQNQKHMVILLKKLLNKRRKFMLDLSNIFNKDMKKAIMSKEKLAENVKGYAKKP